MILFSLSLYIYIYARVSFCWYLSAYVRVFLYNTILSHTFFFSFSVDIYEKYLNLVSSSVFIKIYNIEYAIYN